MGLVFDFAGLDQGVIHVKNDCAVHGSIVANFFDFTELP